jgi:hypothetical protein
MDGVSLRDDETALDSLPAARSPNQARVRYFRLSMIFSENRLLLFRIMLYRPDGCQLQMPPERHGQT